MLCDYALTFFGELNLDNTWIVQQDNSRSHSAASTKDFFDTIGDVIVTILSKLKPNGKLWGYFRSYKAGLGKPSIAIDRSIANSLAVDRKYFSFKKIYQNWCKLYGEIVNCVLKSIYGKILSKKKKHPNPKTGKKSL